MACHGADDGDGGQQKLGFPKIPINPHSPDKCTEFRRGLREFMRKSSMKASIICYLVLASAVFLNVEVSLAQELSVEDRACITGAVAKLPQVAVLKIEGSRAIEGRTLEQSQSQGLRRWGVYRVKVEIDVSVAGQRSTYIFNCIQSGQATVIQPLGMR
jgi:hypothetical protein